jgi:hypothetical protein
MDFDGAFVLDQHDSPSQLYFDAAFRSSLASQRSVQLTESDSVWSIQDAIGAAIDGLANVCLFTYGGNQTGKTYLLRRLLLLTTQDIRRQLASSFATISLQGTEYLYGDQGTQTVRRFYSSDKIEAEQLPNILWDEFRRIQPDEYSGQAAHHVWSLTLENGMSITFADAHGASRIRPDGSPCRPDLAIFSLEQAVLHTVEHAECTSFTKSVAAGLGGNAIGIALCCFGQTAFHRFHENARTFEIAQRLMRIVNRPPVLNRLPLEQAATAEDSTTAQSQSMSFLGELCALQNATSQGSLEAETLPDRITFYD